MTALRRALRFRKFLRQWRPVWAAGLCAASFATGHMLFGDDVGPPAAETPSLLSQYRQATSQMVEESAGSQQLAAENPRPGASDQQLELRHQKSEAGNQRSEVGGQKSEFEGRLLEPSKPRTAADKSTANPNLQIVSPQSQMSHLRPTAVQPAKGVSLVEARPLPHSEPAPRLTESSEQQTKASAALPLVQTAPTRKPLKEIQRPASEAKQPTADNRLAKDQPIVRILPSNGQVAKDGGVVAQASNSVNEENLPPIVPSWAVPRPGSKKRAGAVGRTELIPSASMPNAKSQAANPTSPSMRIELGNPEPRSPATIVLAPGTAASPAPETLRPINSPAAGQAVPVKLPAKDDPKRSDNLRPGTSPFLKPVTYLSDAAPPAGGAAGTITSDSPYRLPPAAPRIEPSSAPQRQEPRLLPMPLEISNPYMQGK